jgi:hypothetical protein
MATRDYLIRLPPDITVKAACEDVGCDQWAHGWQTVCDESTRQGALVANFIRSGQSKRTFTESATWDEGRPVAVFRFESGQRCFREHRTRPARFAVRPGRGPLIARTRLADWGEDLADHLGLLADEARKG